MKNIWRQRYSEISEKRPELDFSVLTAFNANIDLRTSYEDLDWDMGDVDGEVLDSVNNIEDVKSVLKHAMKNGENIECDLKNLDKEFSGEKNLGGQAGIMANFLSGLNGSVTFYTPFLSQELADLVDEKVLHPYFDEEFVLKNVRDASNTDRTKKNIIIEYNQEYSGRVILSDSLRGFGPYFRSGIEKNLEMIDQDVDRILVSGFHNAEGNFEAKIAKSVGQLEKLESPKHLEMVDCQEDKFKHIMEELTPHVESIGLDETEGKKVRDFFNLETNDELHIGEAFEMSKKLIEKSNLERVHLHTYRYHLLVTDKDYPASLEHLRDSMLFGETSAVLSADIGRLPESEDFEGLDFDKVHIKNMDELEEFANFFNLEDFAEKGYSIVEGYKVAAIPTLIHEEPERLVGMGDLISSGTYAYEID
ncbi:MAG: ADP-dependent glucokinase/phosphofructokinase [Candidatus Nanohaloarchaea archaeon]